MNDRPNTPESTNEGPWQGWDNLVEVEDLKKWFPVQSGFLYNLFSGHSDYVRAVDGVTFGIRRGEAFGLAGESGSGKTTVGRLVLRLEEATEGIVRFDGADLADLSPTELRKMRRRMQLIFQDPMASMNPRMGLGEAISHGLRIHSPGDEKRQREIAFRIMEKVGLSPPGFFYDKFPHQISGGQRQRVVIARALITSPDLIVADEPIAMADVSVRSLLLDLMIQLKEELELTYLFITHDLATAKYICERLAIMYLGKIFEMGPLHMIYSDPQHPYTVALLAAVPVPDPKFRRQYEMPLGEIPNPINPPPGCRFHPRCPEAVDICSQEEPLLRPVGGKDRLVACHLRS
jgi:peptide/nickel transport system ATP-binding protein